MVSALLVVLVLAMIASVRLGAAGLSWHDFFHAYFHYTGTTDDVIVRQLRMPRVFVAVEVGAALAVAGGVIQGMTRNPLADPGILGINAGAALFVAIGIEIVGVSTPSQFVWFAFPGAALGTLLAFTLALVGRGRPTALKLTLAGAITGSVLTALTEAIIVLKSDVAGDYSLWALGDVGGRSIDVVYVTAPIVAVGLIIAFALGGSLNAVSLGEEMAHALGVGVMRTRVLGLLATVLLAGAAVAAAGPIVFVGVAVPNGIRALVGNDYRWLLPVSALGGAIFVLCADLVGRIVDRPTELQTGIVVAIVGGPIFLALVSRRRLARV